MRHWLLAGLATASALAASALVLAHSGPHHQAVTVGKGPRLSVTTAPSSLLEAGLMHSVYLANLTDHDIDRVAIVPLSIPRHRPIGSCSIRHWGELVHSPTRSGASIRGITSVSRSRHAGRRIAY